MIWTDFIPLLGALTPIIPLLAIKFLAHKQDKELEQRIEEIEKKQQERQREDEERQEQERERQREESKRQQQSNPKPPPQKDPEITPAMVDKVSKDAFAQIQKVAPKLPDLIDEMVKGVPFTTRKVQVGRRTVSAHLKGIDTKEVPWVSDNVDVRPIRDASEAHRLLVQERMLPSMMRHARVAAGESLVHVDIEETPIYEYVTEPIYQIERRVLYILLDISPSMWEPEWEWRKPVWRGIMIRLVERALAARVPCTIREFSATVEKPWNIMTPKDVLTYFHTLFGYKNGRGTNIGLAIETALKDFKSMDDYDKADIVIVTDGDDNCGMEVDKVRKHMDAANVRLHALMIGAENPGLLKCADAYQVIEKNLNLHPVVKR